jgi:hypothetical protein
MNLLQNILILRIEWALGIKLHDWQKQYLLNGVYNPPPGRANGKTTIHCVRLALSDGPYTLRDIESMRDEDHGWVYPRWYRNKFMEIRDILKAHGFKVCEIKK